MYVAPTAPSLTVFSRSAIYLVSEMTRQRLNDGNVSDMGRPLERAPDKRVNASGYLRSGMKFVKS